MANSRRDRTASSAEHLQDFAREVVLAARSLRKRPGLTSLAVLMLAAGIGATTTIFSLVNGILWQPLAFDEPDRIVRVWGDGRFSKQQFRWLEEQSGSYDSLTAWYPRGYVTRGDDRVETTVLRGPEVAAGFFDVLRGEAALGRTFEPGDDRRGGDAVIISHGLWQSRYGGAPDVLGRTLVLGGTRRTIVGVMPDGFDVFQRDAQVVVPFMMEPDEADYAEYTHLTVFGRLRPGVSRDQAQGELRRLLARWRPELGRPDDWGRDARVVSLLRDRVGAIRPRLVLLLGAVALLLLVANANVANILLARALARRSEVALRTALGATPGLLWRRFLTESILLALAGGALGLLLAAAGLRAVVTALPAATPRLNEVGLDAPVLLFALLVTLTLGAVLGTLPALQSLRSDVRSGLGVGGAAAPPGPRRWRHLLVVAETGLAMLLLFGATLLGESFRRVLEVDPGLRTQGLLILGLGSEATGTETRRQATAYYDRLRQSLLAVPGIEAVATALRMPFHQGGWSDRVYPEGTVPDGHGPEAYWRPVSRDYFQTAGIRLRSGRPFEGSDLEDSPPVCVLTETAARRLFPDGRALGRSLVFPGEGRADGIRVVGIVADVRLDGLDRPAPPVIYRPFPQVQPMLEEIDSLWQHFLVRSSVDVELLRNPVWQAVKSVDPYAPIQFFQPVEAVLADSLADRRLLMIGVAIFAAAAVVLGATGLFAVLGYSVAERTREMGIRFALGASRRRVSVLVLGDGLRLTLGGLALGLAGAWMLSRFLRSQVFGIGAMEPAILAGVAGALLGVGLLAAWIPAARAGQVDPIVALKAE